MGAAPFVADLWRQSPSQPAAGSQRLTASAAAPQGGKHIYLVPTFTYYVRRMLHGLALTVCLTRCQLCRMIQMIHVELLRILACAGGCHLQPAQPLPLLALPSPLCRRPGEQQSLLGGPVCAEGRTWWAPTGCASQRALPAAATSGSSWRHAAPAQRSLRPVPLPAAGPLLHMCRRPRLLSLS